ncbi:MAG: EI24 domain-containing protein [Magnetospirillum sp.]|nr:EI24 domain-containing protein [Magnetospirillum sp.]
MIAALVKALAQLSDPRLRRVLYVGVLAAVLAYLALVGIAWAVIARSHWFDAGWAETGSHLLADALVLILPLPFFPALATTAMSAMLERVAEAVEERHYPQLNWPRPQKWAEILATTLRFLGVTLVVNAVALPLYGALLFTGLTIVVSAIINGYLLGREYFEVVAFRWLRPKDARRLFRERAGRLWLAGAIIYGLFQIPVVNLVAPVIATAFMTHLFQALRPRTREV